MLVVAGEEVVVVVGVTREIAVQLNAAGRELNEIQLKLGNNYHPQDTTHSGGSIEMDY